MYREEAELQAREREAREHEAREREARERDRKLEAERERRLREEKERERRDRERADEERAKLERAAKLEREQKRKQEELKWERERDQRLLQQQQRLGKRSSYQDSSTYDMPKRQAVHDLRSGGIRGGSGSGGGGGGMNMYELSSSVFSRLDPQKQAAAEARVGQLASGIQSISSLMPSGKTGGVTASDGYNRRSSGGDMGGGGYRQGGGAYGAGGLGGRERHLDSVSYPMPKSSQNASVGYQKTPGSIGGGVTVVQKGGLSRQNQDIITAALANIQKSVHQSPSSSVANQMRIAGSSAMQQQISPTGHVSTAALGDYVSMGNRGQPVGGQIPPSMGGVSRQMMGGGIGGMGKPLTKLPPEEERYNRRFGQPTHGGRRQPNMKRF